MSKSPASPRGARRTPRSVPGGLQRATRIALQVAVGVLLGITAYRVAAAQLPAATAVLVGVAVVAIFAAWVFLRFWWVPTSRLPRVQVGEIWWADVPFEESNETKDRPALVVSKRKRSATVLMFTSADKRGRPGYLAVDPYLWRTPRSSYLRTDREITIPLSSMRRRERPADARLMEQLGRSGSSSST